jgi:polyisoprenoid-binding protein YceI
LPLALLFHGGSALEAQSTLYEVNTAASHLFVVTHKSGLLSFFGHEHAILPTQWRAELCLEPGDPSTGRAAIVIDARSLVVDTDSARLLAGLGNGPNAEDRQEIQGKLLDTERLDVENHPEIRLETVAMNGTLDDLDVRATLNVRGRATEVLFSPAVERLQDGTLHVSGSVRVKQSDFGIERERVGGVVNVADEVDLHFDLTADPTERPCPG